MTETSSRSRVPAVTAESTAGDTPTDIERLRALLAALTHVERGAGGTRVAEALSALPGLLDEVERLRSDVDSWSRMYAGTAQVWHRTCTDIAKLIERGGSLAQVVDLIGDYMDVDGLSDETVDLLLRARAAATGAATDPEGVRSDG